MGVEPRGGTAGRLSQSTAPDAFRSSATGLTLTLGRRIAKAQIEAKFDHSATRYTNNAQQGRNLDTHRFELRGYYNFGPKLSAFVEVGRHFLDYRDPGSTLGGDRIFGFGGLRWQATAKTSGELKIGREKRAFDEQLDSAFGYTWDLDLEWVPRTNSSVRVLPHNPSVNQRLGSVTRARKRTRLTVLVGFMALVIALPRRMRCSLVLQNSVPRVLTTRWNRRTG